MTMESATATTGSNWMYFRYWRGPVTLYYFDSLKSLRYLNSDLVKRSTGNWSGGTGKYSYAWMVVKKEPISTPYILQLNSYNYTSGNSATFSFVPNDNGQYYVETRWGRRKSDRSESIRLGQIKCTSSPGLVQWRCITLIRWNRWGIWIQTW